MAAAAAASSGSWLALLEQHLTAGGGPGACQVEMVMLSSGLLIVLGGTAS
jgi:hypothetical protein